MRKFKLRLLISAGGTGGGVYPALSVAEALSGRAEILWIGGERGMEKDLVGRAGLKFAAIPAAGLHGVGVRSLPGNLLRLVSGISAARKLLRQFRPDVLFFTGGFVGTPVAVAGFGIPKLSYVPDIEPALALRFTSRLSRVVALTTETSRRYFGPSKKTVVTGYPTRPDLGQLDATQARRALGLTEDVPVLLVSGGSRGARSINRAVWKNLPELLQTVQVVHITGKLDWIEVEGQVTALPAALKERYHPHAYLHEEMGAALASADLVVSRAGASTLGEYPLFALPAVLVPYPHSWRYQRVNAKYLVDQGAAILIEDQSLSERLLATIEDLIGDQRRLADMAEAMGKNARPTAADEIGAELLALAGSKGGDHD